MHILIKKIISQLFLKNYYQKADSKRVLEKTILFNSYGFPELVKLYIYDNQTKLLQRVEIYELRDHSEKVFLKPLMRSESSVIYQKFGSFIMKILVRYSC